MGTLTFIIILGIISSIFGKMKGNNPKNRNKPFSMNNLDDLRGLFTNKPSSNQINQMPEVTMENIQKKYQRVKQEKVTEQPVVILEEFVKAEEAAPSPKKVTSDRPGASSETDKIINGIIWSEILGEPRAKKSYLSSKR